MNKRNTKISDTVTEIEFIAHCEENRTTALQLEKLMPLADLIPTLQEIVAEKKAMSIISKKFLKWTGIIISICLFIWQIIKELKR